MENKLKQIRRRKYLSQEQLAKLSDVTEQTIVALEHNRQFPKYVTIHKLAKALGVQPEDLKFEVID
jgi:putative transcriptional regulator